MSTEVFNREMRKFMNNGNHQIFSYLNDKYIKSASHHSYFRFFEDFLRDYGIISFDCEFDSKTNKYFPFVKYKENNIFFEEKGFYYLSNSPVDSEKCFEMLAYYMFEKLSFTTIENFENWK
jgi:hypothetical protein